MSFPNMEKKSDYVTLDIEPEVPEPEVPEPEVLELEVPEPELEPKFKDIKEVIIKDKLVLFVPYKIEEIKNLIINEKSLTTREKISEFYNNGNYKNEFFEINLMLLVLL